VLLAEATDCYASCTFDWTVDGVDAGTTTDDGEPATFFTAQSQLSHLFATGSHVVSVTITDGLQRTVTLEVEFDVAAAALGSPPETDTLGDADGSDAGRHIPAALPVVSLGLLLLVAGLGASRRGEPSPTDQWRGPLE
jgi:hypothetical protein